MVSAKSRFVAINNAYEILKDPVKKNVYDHLGITSLISCEKCLTFKEYFYGTMGEMIGFYSGTSIAITSMGLIGGQLYAPYWRMILFLPLVALDILWKTCVNDPLEFIMHWRTPAEKVILARELFIVLSIALSQIGPFFFPVDSRTLKDLIVELEALTHKELEGSMSRIVRIYGPHKDSGMMQ
jgi:curved DNA-binding protein CbpA